jgi:hypothetical protein
MPPPRTNSAPEPRPPDSGTPRCPAVPLVPGLDRRPAAPWPRPDPAAVRLFAVPESAPPYDHDTVPAGEAAAGGGTAAAGASPPGDSTAAAGATPPGDSTAAAGATPPGDSAAQGTAPADDTAADSSPPGGTGAGDGAWPSRFAQVLAETLAGSRSQGQIAPWTSGQARRRLRQLGPMLAAGTVPRVRRVVTSYPAAGVVEMTVVVGFGPRVRALAVRLERAGPRRPCPGRDATGARWVCTAIEAA